MRPPTLPDLTKARASAHVLVKCGKCGADVGLVARGPEGPLFVGRRRNRIALEARKRSKLAREREGMEQPSDLKDISWELVEARLAGAVWIGELITYCERHGIIAPDGRRLFGEVARARAIGHRVTMKVPPQSQGAVLNTVADG